MGHEVTIGGERLGSGKKMKAYLHNYERSTHDLGYIWRSTMAPGTLVPFLNEVALPGDTFDIDLDVDVLTHPTIGPLFGSFKVQLDVFQIPMRLYNAKLHMNAINIGMDMSSIYFPVVKLQGPPIQSDRDFDSRQMNPSAIWNYLGIRGIGRNDTNRTIVEREFSAVPFLAYWDIYKNYYANKQEEIGAVIHTNPADYNPLITTVTFYNLDSGDQVIPAAAGGPFNIEFKSGTRLVIVGTNITTQFEAENFAIMRSPTLAGGLRLGEMFATVRVDVFNQRVIATRPTKLWEFQATNWRYTISRSAFFNNEPLVSTFDLSNIDEIRMRILGWNFATPYLVQTNLGGLEPYAWANQNANTSQGLNWSSLYSQEGLALKTYQSDLFNNWISTEWIDGPNGVSAITAIDTTSGGFTIDELNMSKKIYDMLNRIAISGGTYDDWLDAVYTHKRQRSAENPIYVGGLMTWLQFQEVISNSQTSEQPLGTLAGRGRTGSKRKGGKVIAKIDEPSYIMGIVSLTPILDYSQGNKWDVNLKTMNDLHKPALDQIGFQELITDQMAYWSTMIPAAAPGLPQYKSAGKQPAWINYMTNVNVVKGNFAEPSSQMFMVLTRRYEPQNAGAFDIRIKDLTTYIDPAKFNYIFADTRRDAQNFWVQIGCDITARRKMSAKIMPNL